MIELGGRRRTQPAPPAALWHSLAEPRDPAARPWLELEEGEVEPRILESRQPELVTWSSLWPERPHDRVRFDIESDGAGGTALRWTLLGEEPAAEPLRLRMCYRLNVLINERLRFSYGQ